jgi:hypothetical protein
VSHAAVQTTECVAPAPVAAAATLRNGTVTVGFAAPATPRCAADTYSFAVEYTADDVAGWEGADEPPAGATVVRLAVAAGATAVELAVAALAASSVYSFRVVATNPVGATAGPWVQLDTNPRRPEGLSAADVEQVGDDVLVSWLAPTNPNGAITEYRVHVTVLGGTWESDADDAAVATTTPVSAGAGTFFLFRDAAAATRYTFAVEACNGQGCAVGAAVAFTAEERVATGVAAPTVRRVGADEYTVVWAAPAAPNGLVVGYTLRATACPITRGGPQRGSQECAASTTELTAAAAAGGGRPDGRFEQTIYGATPSTHYALALAVANGAGVALSPGTTELSTAEAVPTVLGSPLITATDGGLVVRCNWSDTFLANGPIRTYAVRYFAEVNGVEGAALANQLVNVSERPQQRVSAYTVDRWADPLDASYGCEVSATNGAGTVAARSRSLYMAAPPTTTAPVLAATADRGAGIGGGATFAVVLVVLAVALVGLLYGADRLDVLLPFGNAYNPFGTGQQKPTAFKPLHAAAGTFADFGRFFVTEEDAVELVPRLREPVAPPLIASPLRGGGQLEDGVDGRSVGSSARSAHGTYELEYVARRYNSGVANPGSPAAGVATTAFGTRGGQEGTASGLPGMPREPESGPPSVIGDYGYGGVPDSPVMLNHSKLSDVSERGYQ